VLLEALKQGHYYSSQGPQIHEVAVSGNEMSVACSPVDTIVVVCGNSRTVGRHGRAITSATLDLAKLDKGWLLKEPSPWLRAVVIDHSGRRAWTNPIWRDEL
jgi:hypothetical protein